MLPLIAVLVCTPLSIHVADTGMMQKETAAIRSAITKTLPFILTTSYANDETGRRYSQSILKTTLLFFQLTMAMSEKQISVIKGGLFRFSK